MILQNGTNGQDCKVNSNSLKDYISVGQYKGLLIKATGTEISFIVRWKNTLHKLTYDTNDILTFKVSDDNGETWTTKKTL